MPAAIRVVTRLQDQDDFQGALTDGFPLVYATSTGKFSTSALSASTITSGTFAVARLGSGTANDTTFLRGDSTWQTVTVPSSANPSGLIGMTAVNGVATTFAKSDARHAIDPAIVPTWIGLHTFQAQTSGKAAVFKAAVTTPDNIVEFQNSSSVAQVWINPLGKVVSIQNITAFSGGLTQVEIGLIGGNPGIAFGLSSDTAIQKISAGVTAVKPPTDGTRQLLRVYRDATAFIEIGTNWAGTGYTAITGPTDSPLIITGAAAYGIYLTVSGFTPLLLSPTANLFQTPSASASNTIVTIRGVTSQTGVALQVQGQSSTTAGRPQADFDTAWIDSTDATRKAMAVRRVWDTVVRETDRGWADGTSGRFAAACPASAPTDAHVGSSQVTFWVDESGNNLTFRVKYANGTTIKSGTVALT